MENEMKVIDNRVNKFGNDLKEEIKANDSCFIASAVFSMYGFYELKKELKNIKELDFIFTNPTFIKEKKDTKTERIFELDNFKREKSISGSEFEIKLKNKLNGKAIAKEYLKEGVQVAVFGRRLQVLEAFAKEASEEGYSIYYETADVSKPDEVRAFAGRVAEKFGHIDI